MNVTKKDILFLTVMFILFSVLLFGQSSNFLIDFSREITIPFQMNNHQNLFSDIFLIYGFWGYFVNFLLYKIQANISVLQVEANILTYLITLSLYFIFVKFCDRLISFWFCVFFILCSVFSCATFSFVVPYSYCALWAYFALYLILFSYLYKKDSLLYLSLGLLAVCRFEFFLLIGLLILFLKFKNKDKLNAKALLVLLFPAVLFLYIFINHISFDSILNNLHYIKKMAQTQSLIYFYKGMGVLFEKEYFFYNVFNLLCCVGVFSLSYFLFYKNKKFFSYSVIVLFFIITKIVFVYNLAVFILITLFSVSVYKKKISYEESVLVIFSILMSIKSVFALNIFGYGNFSFVLVIFSIYLLLSKLLNCEYLKYYFLIYFIILSVVNLGSILLERKIPLKSDLGTVFIKESDSEAYKLTDKFIKENLSKDESLLVIPEGQIFNFTNNKKWQFFNSTFTPLDFETFNDDYFISQLKKVKTDYVIFFPRDTQDYNKTDICSDYAVDFCSYISDNYIKVKEFEKYNIKIFKRKHE